MICRATVPLLLAMVAAPASAEELADSGLLAPPPAPVVEPVEGQLQGGSTHGLQELRVRHYESSERLPDFPDEPVFDYQEVVERLNISGGNAKLTLGLQGDAIALFSNEYILDGEREFERELYGTGMLSPHPNWWFAIEKVWLTGRKDSVSWTFGDSYAAFGRGIALNLVKNTDVDVDTSLRGAHLTYSQGSVEVRLVEAMTNPQQIRLEYANQDMQPDRPHAVHGVRIDHYGRAQVGVHAVAYQFLRELDPAGDPFRAYGGELDAGVVGLSVQASSVGPFDLGGEFDYIGYGADDLGAENGYAGYLSASAYPGVAAVLIEGKVYKNAEQLNTFASVEGYELSTGPSLEYERAITEDSSATLNSNDIFGARVRTDFNLGKGGQTLTPYVAAAAFRDSDLGGVHFNESPETVLHGLGGILWVAGEFHVLANAGYRVDLRDDAPESNPGDSTAHLDASVTIPLGHKLSVELAPSVMRYHWGENPVQQLDYTDVSNTLALKVGTPWAFLLYTDYSDNELINSVGNVSENVYAAGEVQWQPNSATTLKLFYGSYRAGIRCAGGQCRSLPGFQGARASLTANF